MRTTLSLSFLAGLLASSAQAAPPPPPRDDRPPSPPHCSYAASLCTVESKKLRFTVNSINGKTPASLEDCHALPPCHMPPPSPHDHDGPPPPPPPPGEEPPRE